MFPDNYMFIRIFVKENTSHNISHMIIEPEPQFLSILIIDFVTECFCAFSTKINIVVVVYDLTFYFNFSLIIDIILIHYLFVLKFVKRFTLSESLTDLAKYIESMQIQIRSPFFQYIKVFCYRVMSHKRLN